MKSEIFNQTRIAKSLALILGSSLVAPVYAQESDNSEDNLEVIQVRGIRGSVQEAMGIKRESSGVVDAISAEDIGKFPDTNLAESLQRITGISINRNNGEGNQVTARGFGPDFNMVTLNGRTMPGSALPIDGGVANSRAFDFSDLASEGIRAVEVYKTGKASIATGGIGATINIRTARPFDAYDTGFTATAGFKALNDTTNRVGDDVTPEVSTILNYVDEDKTFGVTFTGAFQDRDSAALGAFVNQWRVNPFDGTVPQSPSADNPASGDPLVLNNAPAIGQLFAIPSDLRYYVADRERERTNAQLTVQFAPSDRLTTTLDYTYSTQSLFEARAEQSIWMDDRYFAELTFDNETIKTPIQITQERRDLLPRDLGLALQELNQVNENKSFGLNLEYLVNDRLTLIFDAHHSSAEGRPDAPYGTWTNFGLGANVVRGQGVDFSGEFPIMMVDFDDAARGNLNPNGVLDQGDVGTSILDMNFSSQDTEVTQFRLDGVYEFDEGDIQFGVESRSMESTSQQSLTRQTMGNWGIENPGELPAGSLTPLDLAAEFEDFNTNGIFSQGFTGNLAQLGAFAAQTYGFEFATTNPFATNRTIEEEITAVYFELDLSGEISTMPYNLLVGVRYEHTDTPSIANIEVPDGIAWEGNNDFNVRLSGSGLKEDVEVESSYDHILPALDFDIELTDEVVTRFSYSKTIARPTYNHLSAGSTVAPPTGPTLLTNSPTATASSGNPFIVPLESDNFDISVEYYFDEASYVSLGFYDKRVKNFIGNEQVEENVFGLRDVTAGPRAIAAMAELERLGIPLSDTSLFNMVAAMENNVDYFSLTDEQFEAQFDILPNSDDPLMTFINSKPVNNRSANIYGFELAAQHFFGDSGFGVMANYTTVNGDIGFDINANPSVTQFALVGLSDTANVILMYEKHGILARIAYNWRDEFLDTASQFINEPGFTESLSQVDFNVSYEVTEDFTVFIEGINITEENSRRHGRTAAQLWRLEELGARYAVGARYKF